jgi:sterol desaturase/sphingolipid hydroxylase (fatty acid hydroxylase superfamily)
VNQIGHWIADVQQWLYQSLLQPLLFAAGWMQFEEVAFDATEWLIIGALEIVLLVIVLGSLERWAPAQVAQLDAERKKAIRVDMVYTVLHRLGGFAVLAFLILQPLIDWLDGELRWLGYSRVQLDSVWPGVSDIAVVSLLIYLVVLDFVDYWIHRAQHQWQWWWGLHSLHHSQQHMTYWSDNRNHLLDDLIRDGLLALLALLIGVAPSQYFLIVVLARIAQSVQHANWRTDFGWFGRYALVSPSFHRLHHAVGYGHEGAQQGCNFAVLFPLWDRLFGTADFRPGYVPTGISDQGNGRDYGQGFWAQQWLGLKRTLGAKK